MRGDLQFWRSSGTWYERLIVAATDGPFVHVSIDMGDGTIIEAQTRGVVRSSAPSLPDPRIVVYPLHLLGEQKLRAALRLVEDRAVGGRYSYGWVDIGAQFLRLLTRGRFPFYIGKLHSLDCSHLAAMYAAWALGDAALYGRVVDEGVEISPNDLARYFGLVAGEQKKAA